MTSNFKWIALGSLVALVALLIGMQQGSKRQPLHAGMDGKTVVLRVYCAAGLRVAFDAVKEEYEKEYNVRIESTYDSSGALLSAIRAGGKGDLYLAASKAYMTDGREYGLIEEVVPVALQHPVLVVRVDDEKTKNISSLEDVVKAGIRLSLADPERAAISRAARKSLEGTGQWESLWKAKMVSVDTVNRVANDVTTKAVDAGIVWSATADQYDELKTIEIPEFQKAPKEIAMSVLSTTKQPTEALHFLRYLSARDKGLLQFSKLGYEAVEGDKWADAPKLKIYSGGLNRPAVDDMIKAFAKREGVIVEPTYNGCGILVGQMRGGARPDLYFACDTSFMSQVEDLFPVSYSVSETDMVMIVSKDKLDKLQIKTLKDLTRPDIKVGVCSPVHSALGALTKRLMEETGNWEALQPNIQDQPSTADILVAQVVVGGLDAAIVYYANTTLQQDKLEVIRIDNSLARAVQPIGVSNESDYRQLTARLMDRIRSSESQEKFESLGFGWLGDRN